MKRDTSIDIPTVSGIYAIVNTHNGKIYVGSALQLRRRVLAHRYNLRNNIHCSKHLQSAWNQYGESCFLFKVLQFASQEHLNIAEQHWIDFYQASNPQFGYNLRGHASSNFGFSHSEETRKKISQIQLGRRRSPRDAETKAKLSLALKGKPLPPPQRANVAAANRKRMMGKPFHTRKLSDSQVIEILGLFEEGVIPSKQIAEMYNVTQQTICDLKHGRTYVSLIAAYTAARQARF